MQSTFTAKHPLSQHDKNRGYILQKSSSYSILKREEIVPLADGRLQHQQIPVSEGTCNELQPNKRTPLLYMLKKIKPQRITEKIVEQLKENIGRGHFAAGDKLPAEREMAEQMGVSRSSIREAIQILEHTGFLEVIHGRGTFVKEIGRETLTDPLCHLLKKSEGSYRDVYEFRLAIEIWAAGKAAQRISDEQAKRLREIIESMKQKVEQGTSITELDAQFHLEISKASKNSVYYHISNTVFHLISEVTRQSHEYLFLSHEDQKLLLDDHTAICEAIISHNVEAARLLMQKHLGRVERIFANPKRY